MEKKKSNIAFWIAFPIVFVIATALLVFYYDLANGPLVLFILQLIALAGFAVACILLRRAKMRWRLIPYAAIVVTSAILLVAAKPVVEARSAVTHANPEKTQVLQIEKGKVQGVYSEDKKVEVYAGIPFAKPPVGEYRWKEPQDCKSWEGVRDCSYFAAKSMQPGSNAVMNSLVDMYSEKAWHPDYRMYPDQNMSEDSLYLNVWKPAGEETNLPVLVFIHGGSLTSGSTAFEDYNGESLAHENIIVVNVAYRLGVFGYFAHEELASESPNHTTGNYGLLDQIKGLEWVRDNIGFFGGDKDNVTIAGESAGSSSVSALCTSPLASGLFKNAIGESSSLVVPNTPHTWRSLDKAKKTGADIMAEFGCKSIEELRKIPADKLVQTKFSNSSMTIDGYALPKHPYQVYQEGKNNEKALLNGYNVMEADAFVVPQYLFSPTNKSNIASRLEDVFGEEIAKKKVEIYKEKIEKDAFSAFNEIISVYWFIHPHHSWSNMALASGIPVYRYQFTKENGYHSTYHAGEMVYCYGNVEKARRSYAYNQSDYDLCKTMMSYWANFVKTGNPNGGTLPTWPAYAGSGDKVMELGAHVGPFEDAYLKLYPLIDEFAEAQQNKD